MDHSPRFLAIVDAAKARVREVTVEELKKEAGVHLIDVREDAEWAAGHVVGATHLGNGVIERDVEKAFPDLEADLVLYCGGGFRSALAADALQTMGYRKVRSLAGGWRALLAANFPTEKG